MRGKKRKTLQAGVTHKDLGNATRTMSGGGFLAVGGSRSAVYSLPSCSVCAGQTREQDRYKILHQASKLMLLWDKSWGLLSPLPSAQLGVSDPRCSPSLPVIVLVPSSNVVRS